METLQSQEYNEDWYRNRAVHSLKNIGDGLWDYSDSLLLYVPGGDDEYEASQSPEKDYAKLITDPERQYLSDIAPDIAAELPDEFEYIDLGPGTAHKEQSLLDEFAKLGKQFAYRPVDISKHYLKMAEEYATKQEIAVKPVLSPFESLSELLGPVTIPRFASLGLTYINYDPTDILTMLRSIAGADGKIFINAQIRERTDMKAVTNAYAIDAAAGMLNAKLNVLGIDPETGVSDVTCNDSVQTWVTVSKVPLKIASLGIKTGDKLLTFQSLRPSLNQFEADIAKVFSKYKLLDIGQQFVGAILG